MHVCVHACAHTCVRWDFLVECGGTRAACSDAASPSPSLDHRKLFKGSNPDSCTCRQAEGHLLLGLQPN